MAGLDSSAAAAEEAGGSNSTSSGSTPSLDADTAGKTKGPATNKEGPKKTNLGLKMSFRTLSSPKKQEKDKNEPSRFLGEGVSFKAKLIGILEVNEARGDRMCQEALADLKMAIRAAGEHKQRININIAIDGLRLRDEKNGDCLYHHPVHKISFIAQDMSDSRAFGYIFGSPDTGHRFFGIKTDKAASQVVIAMRDLFQVVFELKKKEIEMAKQHIEQHQIKITGGIFTDPGSSIHKNGLGNSEQSSSKMRTISETSSKENENATGTSGKSAHQTSEVIADLLDLEFELNSIQQGIHQMERITPSDPFGPGSARDGSFRGGGDPFGDSFAPATALPPPPKAVRPVVAILLPPPTKEPPPRAAPADPFNPPPRQPHRRGGVRARTSTERFNKTAYQNEEAAQPPVPEKEKHWFDQETESIFGEGELVTPPFSSSTTTTVFPSLNDQVGNDLSKTPPPHQAEPFDVFTDLDPLGTGRSKPYIDRKDFFQELKNPPKKVLKDLVSEAPTEATAPLFQATFDSGGGTTNPRSVPFPSDLVFPRRDPDPFEEADPFFGGSDPFDDDDAVPFPPVSGGTDPFDTTEFADFATFGGKKTRFPLSADSISSQEPDLERISPLPPDPGRSTFHGPLRVSLPPEKSGACPEDAPSLPAPGRQSSGRPSGGQAKPRSKTRLQKQTTMSGLVKLPSPKSSQRSGRLAKQTTLDAGAGKSRTLHPPSSPPNPRRSPASHLESVTLRMRCSVTPSPPGVGDSSRLSGSSAELSDIAPEPPPRPAPNIAPIKPPPLPPKRQQPGYVVRPPPRPPHTDDPSHYDYIENYETSASPTPRSEEVLSPPIPVPARRPRFGLDDLGSAPQRPRRHHPVALSLSNKSNEEDYLMPIPFPLLPPPQKRNQDTNKTQTPSPNTNPIATLLQSSTSATSRSSEDTPTKQQEPTSSTSTSLNLTLSQLTKTGFSDLATALSISPGQLSNMTLQDLTRCLAKLSSEEQVHEEPREEIKHESKEPVKKDKRDKYATLRESVDEEPIFKAEFETNFGDAEPNEKVLEDVFQETLFDKYAVFRELINEEKTEEQLEVAEEETETEIGNESNQKEEFEVEDLETKVENTTEATALSKETEDRYAALRDITFDDCEPEECEPLSDKEESLAEGTQVEEDYDLLTLSRQHSESTESPTMETATMREPQSIIETTIYEEDVSALEADNDDNFEDVPDIVDDVEDLEDASKESTECVVSKENLDQEQMPAESLNHSSSSEKEEIKDLNIDTKSKNEENSESWAKFDACTFPPEKPASEGQGSEGGASPWSSDGKEFSKVQSPAWQEPCNQEEDTHRRRRTQPPSPWKEEGSEEGWEGPWEERPWRENGWSEDGESYYEDAPPRKERAYQEDRRGRRRRISPWKKGQKTSRDTSPWEQGRRPEEEEWGSVKRYPERSMDVDDEEEYECYWKTRPKHRGPSWDDERRRRFESRELNGLDYEEGRKRRPSPWGGEGGERRSSRESISWDEEDRFSQRDYGDRRPRDREGEYRWRREQEMDPRGYAWVRKAGADEEYGRREPTRRKPENRRYYRDHSRESPWEDDYSEQGDEESPQYPGKARSWASKRPSSASDTRRPSDKSPGEYKNRSVDKPQYSLPASTRQDSGEKMGLAEKRYKEKCGMRPRSREDHFNSDQEYDYWPQTERGRRESGGYETRSQTLHSRRSSKYKKGQERSYSQKSPFDDDFASHALSFGADFKSQGGESDASDNVRKKSPINPSRLFTYTDAFPRRRDQPSNDIRPTDIVPSSPLESRESPREDSVRSRTSRGSCNRQSPFEDDFTPPETRPPSGRLASSVSSDVSDQRRSPYRVPSVAEESENVENANGRFGDDVFLPGDDGDKRFADFENDAFPSSSAEFVPSKPVAENKRLDRRVGWSSEEGKRSEKCIPLTKSRIGSLRSDPANIKKSESVNIFRRENDPFDDDFFSGDTQEPGSEKPRPRPDQLRMTDKSNNNSDPFKWTKAFESFNFDEEQ